MAECQRCGAWTLSDPASHPSSAAAYPVTLIDDTFSLNASLLIN